MDPMADRMDEYLRRVAEDERGRDELPQDRNQELWEQYHPAQLRWVQVGGEYRLEVRA